MLSPHNVKKGCYRCGEPFGASMRYRILRQREVSRGNFTTDGFSVYLCPKCAQVMTWAIDNEMRGDDDE